MLCNLWDRLGGYVEEKGLGKDGHEEVKLRDVEECLDEAHRQLCAKNNALLKSEYLIDKFIRPKDWTFRALGDCCCPPRVGIV